jgi:hypothetical protein
MARKVVMVGSTTFPIDAALGAQIVDIMREYPPDTAFLTRGSQGFDQFIMRVAPLIERRCFGYPSKGGADNWTRDIELVKDGDEVLAFLDPDTLDDPNTGTAHVVESALTQKKPVRAYSVVDGALVWVGENE